MFMPMMDDGGSTAAKLTAAKTTAKAAAKIAAQHSDGPEQQATLKVTSHGGSTRTSTST